MGPRRKTQVAEEKEEEHHEVEEVEEESPPEEADSEVDDEAPPKKKRKAPVAKKAPAKKEKAPARKRAPAKKKEEEEEEEEEEKKPVKRKRAPAKKKKAEEEGEAAGEAAEAKTPARPRAKTPKFTEPTTLEDGFIIHPPSLLYKQFGDPVQSNKIAAYDLDGTLIRVPGAAPGSRTFARDENDWCMYNDSVVGKIKQYHNQGYKIVIFSNQGGIGAALDGKASEKIRGKVKNFVTQVDVPVLVLLAASRKDEWRKPGTEMWDFFCNELMGGEKPDMSESFFVGHDDESGSNRGFAQGTGLTCRSEVDEFGPMPDPKEDRGAAGGAPAPVKLSADEEASPNAELVSIFHQLANKAKVSGEPNARFKVRADEKVAQQLTSYPKKITNDPEVLKEVAALEGVGKTSMKHIKEYVQTGHVTALDPVPEERQGTAPTNKQGEAAMSFM